jgi:hypothetical protein
MGRYLRQTMLREASAEVFIIPKLRASAVGEPGKLSGSGSGYEQMNKQTGTKATHGPNT